MLGYHLNADKITTNYTEQLAEFLVNLKYEDIPPEVAERAKFITMQVVGVSLATSKLPIAKKAAALARACGGKGGEGDAATIWVDGEKSSVPGAVFCNSTLADAMDWEDCSWTGHPSAGISPVALSVGESLHKSGKDVITAVVAGYEVYQRIAMAVQPPADWPNLKGWGLTSWQIYAALAPAAKLYGLDAKQVNQAFGFGATSCPIPGNLHHMTMSDGYHYEHGFRSMEGVMAVRAAMEGVENYCDCFDDPWAFENHLSTDPKPEWYTKDLGTRWLTMETLLKHWPANMWIQTPLELTYNLITKHNIKADDVEELIVDPPTYMRMYYSPEGYSSVMQGQFSIPYMLAMMILDPKPSSAWNDEAKLKDPKVLELAARIKGGPSEQLIMPICFKNFQKGHHPVITVTIRTKDGREVSETMERHLGHPYNMMNREEFCERFRVQAGDALPPELLEEAVEAFANLEECDDVSKLAKYFKSI